jgi:hypothetical protein
MNKGVKTPYDALMLQYFMFFIWKNTYFNT